MSKSLAQEDHWRPYMADYRRAPDTLLFVCEEDWRLYEKDAELTPQDIGRAVYTADAAAADAADELDTVALGTSAGAQINAPPAWA